MHPPNANGRARLGSGHADPQVLHLGRDTSTEEVSRPAESAWKKCLLQEPRSFRLVLKLGPISAYLRDTRRIRFRESRFATILGKLKSSNFCAWSDWKTIGATITSAVARRVSCLPQSGGEYSYLRT